MTKLDELISRYPALDACRADIEAATEMAPLCKGSCRGATEGL